MKLISKLEKYQYETDEEAVRHRAAMLSDGWEHERAQHEDGKDTITYYKLFNKEVDIRQYDELIEKILNRD